MPPRSLYHIISTHRFRFPIPPLSLYGKNIIPKCDKISEKTKRKKIQHSRKKLTSDSTCKLHHHKTFNFLKIRMLN